MDKKLYDEIRVMVKDIFSEQADSEKQKKVEEALNKSAETIADLTESLRTSKADYMSLKEAHDEAVETAESQEAKIVELEESKTTIEADLEAAKEEITQLKEAAEAKDTELEDLKTSKEEVSTQLEEAKKELEDIEKAKVASTRYAELEEAKVSSSDKEKQLAKIIDMTDGEFSAYKEDLVAIHADITKNIQASDNGSAQVDDNASADALSDDKDDRPSLAHIDDQVIFAALNAEAGKHKDVVSKYRDMGKAMAESMKKTTA